MPSGILLQPELIVSYIKGDPDDQRFQTIYAFFSGVSNDYIPSISTVSYGLTRSAILAAPLTRRQRRELETRLRTFRRKLTEDGSLYNFDTEAADEYAIVRQACREQSIPLDTERQFEYAIALAKGQAILAPTAAQHIYPSYPSLTIEYI